MSVAERQQACPRCGSGLDVTGQAVGTWLACPGCSQPIQVVARRIERPAKPAEPEPPSAAWLADPRLDAPAASPPRARPAPRVTETTPPLPAWSPVAGGAGSFLDTSAGGPAAPEAEPGPDPYLAPVAPPARGRRRYGGVVFMLAVMSATAQVIFVSSVLQAVSRPEDVALSALFGAGLGTFAAMMSVSVRREDEARARGGR